MRACIYARKSTSQENVSDEQRSVARQVEHARAFAIAKGWTVADDHVFSDDGISGATFDRPGFVRLKASLKPRPPFEALVVSEESRLGRESIQTAYALREIIGAGVRVFTYLTGAERKLDSAQDKILLSLASFADEVERERARARTTDAMTRKARAGHVTGGRCFGYQNREVTGPDGRRSHVEREVIQSEADVVRTIFTLCAEGYGKAAIAKLLNERHDPSPQSQQGRPMGWAPSSVREVLYRDLYRGEVIYGKTRKVGPGKQVARPEAEWIRMAAPDARIVSDADWQAAHVRLTATRETYLRTTDGRVWGRPLAGLASKC
jgi:site-specific DNA recombinase